MNRLIVEMQFGSHLYGTATPQSDLDLKAIYLPEARDILLGRAQPTINEKTKQDERAKNTPVDIDREIFSLQKYFDLVSEGQTLALDMLFAPPKALTVPATPEWDYIQRNRHRLLTKRSKKFIDYCRHQANKYGIKGSRMAAAREVVNLLKGAIEKHGGTSRLNTIWDDLAEFMDQHEHVEILERTMPGDVVIQHLSVCGRQVPYTASIKTAFEVYSNLFREYGKRTLAAMNNEGIDWKALSHAVRVGHQGVEVLTTGHVTFPRPEAAHLLAIKTGQLPYAVVAEEIESLLVEVQEAARGSVLPDAPDIQWIEDFVSFVYRKIVKRG